MYNFALWGCHQYVVTVGVILTEHVILQVYILLACAGIAGALIELYKDLQGCIWCTCYPRNQKPFIDEPCHERQRDRISISVVFAVGISNTATTAM